jgi:hypothetical protein
VTGQADAATVATGAAFSGTVVGTVTAEPAGNQDTLSSVAGLAAGTICLVGNSAATQETLTVQSIAGGTVTWTANRKNAHTGEPVYVTPWQVPLSAHPALGHNANATVSLSLDCVRADQPTALNNTIVGGHFPDPALVASDWQSPIKATNIKQAAVGSAASASDITANTNLKSGGGHLAGVNVGATDLASSVSNGPVIQPYANDGRTPIALQVQAVGGGHLWLNYGSGGNILFVVGTQTQLTLSSLLLALLDGLNISTGTAIGTQLATANNQKLGFFGKTPIVQPTSHGALTAGASYGSNEQNMLNDVYGALRALGLIA